MSDASFLKRNWKVAVNILTIVALVFLIIAVRHQIIDTFLRVRNVDFWALLLLIPIEWINYDAQARLYQGLFKVVGNKISYNLLFKMSLELNFVNSVFPSGGVSGISYFGVRMRGRDITGGKAAVVQMMKLMLLFLSFEVLLLFGLVFMAIGGRVNSLVILVSGSLSTLLVIGTIAFVMIIGHERRINASFTAVTRMLNRMIHIVRPKHPETINTEKARKSVEDLHHNYKVIESEYRQLKWPLLWAFVANASEVAAVYVVYIAFGHWVNVGSVILAYSIANFAGLVSVLPGGVGIYEALMTAVLAVAGVRASLSIPVTIMYRVLNMAIQLPPGFYLYHRSLHKGDEPVIEMQEPKAP